MKKIILGITTIACLAIASCSSDDNSTQDNPVVESPSKKFEGKWKMVTGIVIYNGQTQTQDLKPGDCDYDFYDLKSNGSKDEVYHETENNCTETNWVGTWNYNADENTITAIDSDDNYTVVFEIIEFSTNTMKVKLIEDDGVNPENSGFEIYSILQR